jgi:ferredoxin
MPTTLIWKVRDSLGRHSAQQILNFVAGHTGACESSMACSTCHVILEDDVFHSLDEACEDEEDMLDMAFGLTDTCVSPIVWY